MRIFLDTNVLVSAIATRGLCADLLRLVIAEHQLVLGETVLAELRRILTDKLRLPAPLIRETEQFFREQADIITTTNPSPIKTRDASDDQVLAEAIASAADILVTGDRDLLAVAFKAPLLILSPRGFWEHLHKDRG